MSYYFTIIFIALVLWALMVFRLGMPWRRGSKSRIGYWTCGYLVDSKRPLSHKVGLTLAYILAYLVFLRIVFSPDSL